MKVNNIILANDHAAVEAKIALQNYLINLPYKIINLGTNNKESTHYPYYAEKAAKLVLNTPNSLGIVLCSSGVGISLSCNKINGIRCMLCHTPLMAKLAREQFDINILGIGANIIGISLMQAIVDTYLSTPFNNKYIKNKVFFNK